MPYVECTILSKLCMFLLQGKYPELFVENMFIFLILTVDCTCIKKIGLSHKSQAYRDWLVDGSWVVVKRGGKRGFLRNGNT